MGKRIEDEYKKCLPVVSDNFIKKLVAKDFTLAEVREIGDLAENFSVSPYRLAKMKEEDRDEERAGLTADELFLILDVRENFPVLSIRSLRQLLEACEKDQDIFQVLVDKFVSEIVGDATEKWCPEVSKRMGCLIERVRYHVAHGYFDSEVLEDEDRRKTDDTFWAGE